MSFYPLFLNLAFLLSVSQVSERRIQKLCEENRIPGVVGFSRVWLIPKDAKKPMDGRLKQKAGETLNFLNTSKILSAANPFPIPPKSIDCSDFFKATAFLQSSKTRSV